MGIKQIFIGHFQFWYNGFSSKFSLIKANNTTAKKSQSASNNKPAKVTATATAIKYQSASIKAIATAIATAIESHGASNT